MIAIKSASFRRMSTSSSKSTSSTSLLPVLRRLLLVTTTTTTTTTMMMMMMMMMAILLLTFPRSCLANVSSSKPASYNLTPQQITDYQNDGVIVIRKMLQGEILKDAIKAANKVQRSDSIARRILYKMSPSYRTLNFQTYREHKALKKVAFDSTASTICAKLMGLDEDEKGGGVRHDNNNINNIKVEYDDNYHTAEDEDESQEKGKQNHRSLRLLKDAVMGFSKGDNGCGWHIDGKFYYCFVLSYLILLPVIFCVPLNKF
jgi:hypothetical protein